jgi:hypothetical protein
VCLVNAPSLLSFVLRPLFLPFWVEINKPPSKGQSAVDNKKQNLYIKLYFAIELKMNLFVLKYIFKTTI